MKAWHHARLCQGWAPGTDDSAYWGKNWMNRNPNEMNSEEFNIAMKKELRDLETVVVNLNRMFTTSPYEFQPDDCGAEPITLKQLVEAKLMLLGLFEDYGNNVYDFADEYPHYHTSDLLSSIQKIQMSLDAPSSPTHLETSPPYDHTELDPYDWTDV